MCYIVYRNGRLVIFAKNVYFGVIRKAKDQECVCTLILLTENERSKEAVNIFHALDSG